jgi:hypothetical protein
LSLLDQKVAWILYCPQCRETRLDQGGRQACVAPRSAIELSFDAARHATTPLLGQLHDIR